MALDIGMSELVSNEVAVAQEQDSQNVRGAMQVWSATHCCVQMRTIAGWHIIRRAVHVELHCLSRWTPRQTSSTLVNGVTGGIDGDISLDSLPAVNTLLELDEMSIAEFGEALKAGDLAEVVMIRPEEALNPSSVVDEAVLENTKKELSARSGSAILKDPSDPFYPVLQEYTDVVS
ncbi:hypothetical protein PC120_g9095 [Phytophthora cactorum]|nr:hypothetical protein PC120_g9095 [Phytophthora cactorum]